MIAEWFLKFRLTEDYIVGVMLILMIFISAIIIREIILKRKKLKQNI